MPQPENRECDSNVAIEASKMEMLSLNQLDQPRYISFVFPGEIIRVSGKFLAKSSPVFEALFEGEKIAVPIKDVDADTFKWLLRYIGGRELPEDKVVFNKLLAAAEKYELHKVDTLRKMSSFTQDNWFETLEQALLHKDLKLTRALFEFLFLMPNMEEFFYAPKFLDLSRGSRAFHELSLEAFNNKCWGKQVSFHSHDLPGAGKLTETMVGLIGTNLSQIQWYFDLEKAGSTYIDPIIERRREIERDLEAEGHQRGPDSHKPCHFNILVMERLSRDKKIEWLKNPESYFE